MLDLSQKYLAASSEEQRMLLAAAGEAMLAKGSHGSLGVFIGFTLPTFANVLMSCVMLKGNIFSRATSYIGIIGNSLMVIYIIMVTFMSVVKNLYSSPVGLIPCPTLSLIIGFLLLYNGFDSQSLTLTLIVFGLFYGLFGVLKLAVHLDIFLVFGTIILLIKYVLSLRA